MYRSMAVFFVTLILGCLPMGLALADEVREGLLDPARFAETCASLSDQRFASYAHACAHTTLSPNLVRGGTKTNVIPDEVVIELDIRILPGDKV